MRWSSIRLLGAGEDLVVIDEAPEGVLPRDLPTQPAVFAPDVAPEEIAEIAQKLREKAGLPKEPTGLVADLKSQTKRSTKEATSRSNRVRGSRRTGPEASPLSHRGVASK
jgi:hypothetical protein